MKQLKVVDIIDIMRGHIDYIYWYKNTFYGNYYELQNTKRVENAKWKIPGKNVISSILIQLYT